MAENANNKDPYTYSEPDAEYWQNPLQWLISNLDKSYFNSVSVNRSTRIKDRGTWVAIDDTHIQNTATGEQVYAKDAKESAQKENAFLALQQAIDLQRATNAVAASGAEAIQKAMYYYEEQNKDNNMRRYPAYAALALQLADYEAQNLSNMNRNNVERALDEISTEWRTTLMSSGTAAQRVREATDFYSQYAIEDFFSNEEAIQDSLSNAIKQMNGEIGEDTRLGIIESSQVAAEQNGVFGQAAEFLKAANLGRKSVELQAQGEQLLQDTTQAEAAQLQTVLNQIQAPLSSDANYLNQLKTIALGSQVNASGLFQGALQSVTNSAVIDSGSFMQSFLSQMGTSSSANLAGFNNALQSTSQNMWNQYNARQGQELLSLAKKESQALNVNNALGNLTNMLGLATGYATAANNAANAATEAATTTKTS